MTKEDKYIEQLKEMGIWEEAFRGAVHDLAVLEREQSRTRTAWKKTAEDGKAPSPLDGHYQLILQQGREISRLREELGLTPKALRRIRGSLDRTFRVSSQVSDKTADEKAKSDETDGADAGQSGGPTVLDFVKAKFGT